MIIQDAEVKSQIQRIVEALIKNDFQSLVKEGVAQGEDVDRIKEEIGHYGRTLVPLPTEAFSKNVHEYELSTGDVRLEIQLWTREEGESDLTMILTAERKAAGKTVVHVKDVHVL